MTQRPSREEIDAALRVLLTKSHWEAVGELTAAGYSRLAAVRRILTIGALAIEGPNRFEAVSAPLRGMVVNTTDSRWAVDGGSKCGSPPA